MRNKILISILSLLLTFAGAEAASYKIHVTNIEAFSTANPSKSIDVELIDDAVLGSYELKTGDIIHCSVVKVIDPKRGKRAASFGVCPYSYTSDEQTKTINENFYGKYASKVISKEEIKNVDALKLGKKAAISVGNHFVKGIAPAVSLAEGMIKNEDGNRIQSGVKKVYKDSPLSYVEKGEELNLEAGEHFYLVFKPSKSKKTEDIEEAIIEEEQE